MASLEELVVTLVAETSGLRAELNNATTVTKQASQKMDDAIAEFSKNSAANVTFFESAMATMIGFLGGQVVEAAIEKVKQAFEFLIDQFKEGVKAAGEQEQAFVRLANSLAITGQYTVDTMKDLEDFAKSMEKLTGVSDTQIANNLAMISSLTRLSGEGLKQAGKAALDLSAAMGIDLDSASRLVAKGIDGNVEAFKRYGITIVEGTSKTENLANITAVLGKQMGGAAAGAMQTFDGSVRGLSIAYEDLLKTLGKSVVQNPVLISLIQALTEGLHELSGEADNTKLPMQAVAIISLTIVEAFRDMVIVVGTVVDHLKVFEAGCQAVIVAIAAIGDVVNGTINSISKFGQGIYAAVTGNEALKKSLVETGTAFGEIDFSTTAKTYLNLVDTVTSKPVFHDLIQTLGEVGDKGADAFNKIQKSNEATLPTVNATKAAIGELSLQQIALLTAYSKGLADQGAALDNYYTYQSAANQAYLDKEMADLVGNHANKFELQADFLAQQDELTAKHQADEWANLEKARAAGLIQGKAYEDAKTALSQKQYLEHQKIETDKAKYDKAMSDAKLAGVQTLFQGLSVLQESSSKELQTIGKAAAITTATIDAYLAIQNALANVPFPFNIAAAAGIGVMAFANVAKIAGIGFNRGGTLSGGGADVDSVSASLTKGETVIDRTLTNQLGDFLSGPDNGSGGNVTIELHLKDNLIEFIEAKIVERQRTNVSLIASV